MAGAFALLLEGPASALMRFGPTGRGRGLLDEAWGAAEGEPYGCAYDDGRETDLSSSSVSAGGARFPDLRLRAESSSDSCARRGLFRVALTTGSLPLPFSRTPERSTSSLRAGFDFFATTCLGGSLESDSDESIRLRALFFLRGGPIFVASASTAALAFFPAINGFLTFRSGGSTFSFSLPFPLPL